MTGFVSLIANRMSVCVIFSIYKLCEKRSMCLYKGHRAEHLMSLLVELLLH